MEPVREGTDRGETGQSEIRSGGRVGVTYKY
ncbi:hypothetical protein CLM81_05285, partial [Streptomyces albidoflavus]